jgi:PPOX class probable F420-dependent enzyme
VPIVFVAEGGDLWSPVDGKPKRGRRLARLDQIARQPRASLLVDHYDDDWRALWWVRVDVVASVLTEPMLDAGTFRRVSEALRRKYPQYVTTPLWSGTPTLLRFVVIHRVGWAATSPTPTPTP